MAQIATNDIRPGMKIEWENGPYLVIQNEFVKPGKGQAFNRIKLKNFLTGRVLEKTWKSGEKLTLADIEEVAMRLLYMEQEGGVFMNEETFDQTHISKAVLEAHLSWMKEDIAYDVIFYKGNAIDVTPPTFMELQVTETAPGVKGDTASGRVLKPALLETGAKVQIPIFIQEGEHIKVDTRTGEYVSRI
ncbi:MAG: elongation factor P [Chlamydiota bacterium]